MLQREEAIVLIAIFNEYSDKFRSILREEDFDIFESTINQMQIRLNQNQPIVI